MADLPATQLNTTPALQKLLDLWWRNCTKEGKQLPVYADANGTLVPNVSTSQDSEASYNRYNFKNLNDKLDQVLANQAKIINKLGA